MRNKNRGPKPDLVDVPPKPSGFDVDVPPKPSGFDADVPPKPPGYGEPDGRDLPQEFCFPLGTRIEMADGSLRPIEAIHLGDRVRSWDARRGSLEEGSVVRVLFGEASELIRLNCRLAASSAHRILTARGYLRFDEIEQGELLLRSSDSP